DDSRAKLNTSLALFSMGEGQAEYLYLRLLEEEPAELQVIRDALFRQEGEAVKERLWRLLEDSKANRAQRFRVACALAGLGEPEGDNGECWQKVSQSVVDQLLDEVEANHGRYSRLHDMLHPVRDHLLTKLSSVHRDSKRPQTERLIATNLLASYASDQSDR